MNYEVCVRSPCPEHAGLECIACGGNGYLKQWVPVISKQILERAPGKAHLISSRQMYLMIVEPEAVEPLDLLAGSYESM